jgi:hypothetical protein
MAATFKWKWQRGQKLTVRLANASTGLGEPWSPVTFSSNLIQVPGAAGELLGVVPDKADADETGVNVIISPDIYEVQVASGVALALGDPVEILANGSVTTLASGYVVGYVVDYDPATSGIAHIMARPSILSTGGVNDAAAKLALGGGTMTGNLTFGDGVNIVTNGTTGTKIGTAASQKIGFYNATPVVQAAHATAMKVNYTTGDLDSEAEQITALNLINTEINKLQVILENLGLRASS